MDEMIEDKPMSWQDWVQVKAQFTKAILDNRRDVQHLIEAVTRQTDLLRKTLDKSQELAQKVIWLEDQIEGMKAEIKRPFNRRAKNDKNHE